MKRLPDKLRTTSRFSLEPAAKFADPRLSRSFDASVWPLCNGSEGPAIGAEDLFDRRCLEFLAAFYKINRLNKLLRTTRPKQKKAGVARKAILRRIKQALNALEALEDRYAPIGFFGEPEMEGPFYKNILFVRPGKPKFFPALESSFIAIPGLEDIPKSELVGPARIVRLRHGKMGL